MRWSRPCGPRFEEITATSDRRITARAHGRELGGIDDGPASVWHKAFKGVADQVCNEELYLEKVVF